VRGPLKGIVRHGCDLARWLAQEFLPLSARATWSSRLTDLCRVLGAVTVASLILFTTRGFAHEPLSEVWYAWVFDVTLAVLMGSLVKEGATWICANLSNASGRDFHRRGVTLGGRAYREVFHADRTWRRSEYGDGETITEWTDRSGQYHRSISGPPPQAGVEGRIPG
jgi:hypothetical protein